MAIFHRNEAAKLLATYLNTLAASVMTVGLLMPAAILVYGTAQMKAQAGELVSPFVVCACTSIVLHLAAQMVLWLMQDTP